MEINVFKPGDKVILSNQGEPIGWEKEDYTKCSSDLELGGEYTVGSYLYINNEIPIVDLKEDLWKYKFHPNHFTLKS